MQNFNTHQRFEIGNADGITELKSTTRAVLFPRDSPAENRWCEITASSEEGTVDLDFGDDLPVFSFDLEDVMRLVGVIELLA